MSLEPSAASAPSRPVPIDTAAYDAMVAGFFRAATGELTWPQALRPVARAFGATVASLNTYDMAQGGRMLSLECGGDYERTQDLQLTYIRDWHVTDPRKVRALNAMPHGIGQWFHCHDAFDERFVSRDPFFQNFQAGYDMRFNSNVSLPVTDTVLTAFILELPHARGPLTNEEREWAQRLRIQIHEALRAHERVRRLAAQAMAGQRLLDAFAFPMWLLDGERFILHSTAAARDEAARETLVGVAGNRLALRNGRADQAFMERLHVLMRSPHGKRALVDARARPGDPPCWLHLTTVQPVDAMGVFGERPQVLATLFGTQWALALDPHALGEVFRLTPAQARVAVLMAEGHSAPEMATRLAVRPATVRSHIHQVLARLGARRSTEAVRLLRQGEALWAQPGAVAARA